jgi:hypothetical protein
MEVLNIHSKLAGVIYLICAFKIVAKQTTIKVIWEILVHLNPCIITSYFAYRTLVKEQLNRIDKITIQYRSGMGKSILKPAFTHQLKDTKNN